MLLFLTKNELEQATRPRQSTSQQHMMGSISY